MGAPDWVDVFISYWKWGCHSSHRYVIVETQRVAGWPGSPFPLSCVWRFWPSPASRLGCWEDDPLKESAFLPLAVLSPLLLHCSSLFSSSLFLYFISSSPKLGKLCKEFRLLAGHHQHLQQVGILRSLSEWNKWCATSGSTTHGNLRVPPPNATHPKR